MTIKILSLIVTVIVTAIILTSCAVSKNTDMKEKNKINVS